MEMFAINTENLKYRGYHFQKNNVKKNIRSLHCLQ